MRKIILSILILCAAYINSFASILDGKTVRFSDLFNAMLDDEKMEFNDHSIGRAGAYFSLNGFCLYDEINFEFNREADDPWDQRYAKGGDTLRVKKGIDFLKCQFSEVYWLLFRNTVFEEALCFNQCTRMKLLFKGCVFKGSVLFTNLCNIDFIEFEDCTFERGLAIVEGSTVNQHLKFVNCKFNYNESFIKNPRVNSSQYLIGALTELTPYFSFIDNKLECDLFFDSCYFSPIKAIGSQSKLYVNLSHSSFKSLEFKDCNVNLPVDISFGNVANQFKFIHSIVSTIVADAINFNATNAKLDWNIFAKQKIAIKNEKGEFIRGNDIIKNQNKYDFETLISVYALFYSSYKQQGNRRSANACYVEWKNIETSYMKKELSENFTTDTWFNWFMNIFLKTFCDYGTNPLKSLAWSLIVMLVFTFLFMVYLWNYDTTEHKDIRFVFRNFGQYFTDNKSMIEIGEMMMPAKRDQTAANELRAYIYENRSALPAYYRLFGMNITRPKLSFQSMFFFRVGHKLLGKWTDAKKTKKYLVAIIVSLWISSLLGKIMLIRIFDAFTMSLNSFSTLGYGDLPRSEGMRYLSIIEGFIGWFLLSIFIVALISQIIQ